MKQFILFGVMSLMTLGASAQNNMTVVKNNGESDTFSMADVKSVTFRSVVAQNNQLQVLDADGTTAKWDKPILYAKMKEYKGMEKFYLVLDESSSLTDQLVTPLLTLSPSIYNQGEYDLTKMEANTWSIDFASVQLYSPDNEYMPVPNNGTLTANYDASTGEYEIKLHVQNYYPSSWGEGVNGSGEIITLYYKGIPQAY